MKHVVVQLIDAAIEEDADKTFRSHLGGSMIGEKCERALMYGFRWAKAPGHSGRLLRLFNRGHREEERFVGYLRRIGAQVREYSERLLYHPESNSYVTQPWDEEVDTSQLDDVHDSPAHVAYVLEHFPKLLKQWRISDVNGHFGGSLDGIATGIPGAPDLNEEVLLEFKTYNTKLFVELVNLGVKEAKPTHWYQMQVYMHKKNLKRALYMAVNKNDDDLHAEWVEYDPTVGPKLLEKAARVVNARTLPARVGNHAAWHECKFCTFSSICHGGAPLAKNCRSCANSIPVEDGKWKCTLWNAVIPVDVIPAGCDSYKPITD